jgi:hypothetical protein
VKEKEEKKEKKENKETGIVVEEWTGLDKEKEKGKS